MGKMNPTAAEDIQNLNLPDEMQYPGLGPDPRHIDDGDGAWVEYPLEIQLNYTTLRCSREKYRELPDAQAFFNRKRDEMNWREESAIFRTARFWAKRIIP